MEDETLSGKGEEALQPEARGRLLESEDGAEDSGKKAFSGGADKLRDEENKMLASVKPEHKAAMQAQLDPLFKELTELAKQEPEFDQAVLLPHKSMERCMKFCSDKAMGIREPSDKEKEAARNNGVPIVTPVGSDMLIGWIREYYLKDDKEEVEKEEKRKAAEKELKAEADKKAKARKAAEKKKKERDEKKKAEASAARKNGMEGQFSIFDMMGE
jgi:hypothetical protein